MSVKDFDRIAREIFAPIYPEIAGYIITNTGVKSGNCIDLGCGPGYLGLALAQISELNVFLIDKEEEMLQIAQNNIAERGLGNRVSTITTNVERLPFEDGFVKLAVSRGSLFFWKKPVGVFNEIYRVLSPGAAAIIGGGFGNLKLKQKIDQEMVLINPNWHEHTNHNIGPDAPDKWRKIIAQTQIHDYTIDHSPSGMWIKLVK